MGCECECFSRHDHSRSHLTIHIHTSSAEEPGPSEITPKGRVATRPLGHCQQGAQPSRSLRPRCMCHAAARRFCHCAAIVSSCSIDGERHGFGLHVVCVDASWWDGCQHSRCCNGNDAIVRALWHGVRALCGLPQLASWWAYCIAASS